MIDRNTCIQLIHAARIANRGDFARVVAADWLASWPGDLRIQFLLAQVEFDHQLFEPATVRLMTIINADPEYVEAYTLLAKTLEGSKHPSRAHVFAAVARSLQGRAPKQEQSPSWGISLHQAIIALRARDYALAESEANTALSYDPNLALPSLIAVQAMLGSGSRDAALALAREAHDRWSECIAFKLLLAEDLFACGQTSRGVEYVHQAVAEDPIGEVAARILGVDHPYRNLWPDNMQSDLSRPIPAEVAIVLGKNRLSDSTSSAKTVLTSKAKHNDSASGKPIADSEGFEPESSGAGFVRSSDPTVQEIEKEDDFPTPEPWEAFRGPDSGDNDADLDPAIDTLIDVHEEFERLADQINARRPSRNEDGRVPVYIVLSSRTHLIQAFGADRFYRLDDAIMSLVEANRLRLGWQSYHLYIDDPKSLSTFGLLPADPANAWQIKLRLAELDQSLARRGEMIGAVLIIGGHQIIPFHMLPNPTADDDDAIPSDNPYATTDENYFAPEWPIGRYPSADLDLLIKLLHNAADEGHLKPDQPVKPLMRMYLWIIDHFFPFLRKRPRSLGYSADIWRKSSMVVYRTIGDPRSLITSPPVEADAFPLPGIQTARLSYFNLHGLEDAPEWFGQRDPLSSDNEAEEFPVALRPQDLLNSGHSPDVVFSEACYGANVIGKSTDDALCLKFLAEGSQAVIGSTKISYGSVTPPIIAADLLGARFWENLNLGLPVGEALRRAKLSVASEMHRRQGFLDGEDQKTIISFILYGDPLSCSFQGINHSRSKTVIRSLSRPKHMKTACALNGPDLNQENLNPDLLVKVKTIMSSYLPGMADAQCHIHAQHCGCDGINHTCPTHQLDIKPTSTEMNGTLVATFTKNIDDGMRQHRRYARMTLDSNGKVLKFAVSR